MDVVATSFDREGIPARMAVILATIGWLMPAVTYAQPLGTFRWQQQPYCNVLVVNVVQNGTFFNLDGIDDQCGATGTLAAVAGVAFPNPNGSIGLGLTVVTSPGGTPVHIDATIALPSASGTWRDSTGATGSFTLTPGAPAAGSPRPVPRSAFPGGLSLGGKSITNVGTPSAASDAATKAYVDGAVATKAGVADVRAALVGEKVWKVAVQPNGAKGTTGPYTSSRAGTGRYQIAIDVAGLGLPARSPLVVATPFALAAAQVAVLSIGYSTIGGVLTSVDALLGTFNAAGAATDLGVFALVSMPDADSGSPVPPFDGLAARAGATCSMTGETTRCVYVPPVP